MPEALETDTVRKHTGEIQQRDYAIPASAINEEQRTVELAFASEDPYQRWFGTEILDCSAPSVRLGRLNDGAAVLINHDSRDHVGVVVRAWVGEDKKCRAIVRFGQSARAQEVFQDVKDGIRKLVSVGYRVHAMQLESKTEDNEVYRVTDWEPHEVSLVAVPADATVGVGRSAEPETQVDQPHKSMPLTTEKGNTMPQATAAPVIETVDSKTVAENARKAEQTRIKEISAMAAKFGQAEFGEKHVEAGTSVDEFSRLLLQNIKPSAEVRHAETPEIGMTEKEVKRFSFLKALLAASDPTNQGFQKAAAFELECSNAARERMGDLKKEREGGLTIPTDVLNAPINDLRMAQAVLGAIQRAAGQSQQRDLIMGTASLGGNTVATDLLGQSFIELLVNRMVIMQLGTVMLRDLNGNVAIPRQTGRANTFWVAENTGVTASDQAFDQVALTPKTVGAMTNFSRRLLMQSSIDVEAFVRMDLARAVALALDFGAINGPGTANNVRGILNQSGIGSVAGGANGAVPTWDNMVDLESAVANANADQGALRYLTNSRVRGRLKRSQMFSGTNGLTVWDAVQTQNAPVAVSNQVPSNLTKGTSNGICSAIIYGNFQELLIGMWGGLDVMLDPYTNAASGGRRLVALQDVDIAVRHAESFASMQDALTT